MEISLDLSNITNDEQSLCIHADSIADGLIMSLNNRGMVDIDYITQISGYSGDDVVSALQGSIYQNPESWEQNPYKGWETANEYLSGNLMQKYKVAKEASVTYNDRFTANIKAIEAVLPVPIPSGDIYITLGTPWLPPSIIDDFIEHLLGEKLIFDYGCRKYVNCRTVWETTYEPLTGVWEIEEKKRYGDYDAKSTKTYGTKHFNALQIIEKTLNNKTLRVFEKVSSNKPKSRQKRQLNRAETIAAQEKQKQIIQNFQEWIWSDDGRKQHLLSIYYEKYGCVRQRHYEGQFLTIPGLSPEVELYPYQKNAIARIIFSNNTLLAHDVGAGKTFIMIAAGTELRRMGLSRKNVYAVPNSITGQWRDIFLRMYPQANLLVVEPKTFIPGERQKVLSNIRDNDYDAVIIAYSCFDMIPMSRSYYKRKITNEILEIRKAIEDTYDGYAHTKLMKKQKELEEELANINLEQEEYLPSICFDELGINTLFVDEAHNYKNLTIESKADNILGINKTGSTKCNRMLDKVRYVQQSNNGRGAILATGTPLTNSITDIFVMQTYLQYGELRFLKLNHFDNWVLNFGEKVTSFEIDVDTSQYRLATRISRFHNLPELTNLFAQVADFHAIYKENELPNFYGYDDQLINKTPEMSNYLCDISKRADVIRKGKISRKKDNMLKITTDGRKAALDIRLVNSTAQPVYECKIFRCAENVVKIYFATISERLTQIIFCDNSTPKAAFNVYHELWNLLILFGISESEIAFIHDYDIATRRTLLYEKMQRGAVRILLGSTPKLGIGVNVQRKLYAIHHLDIPWRPSDMVQREGRILRQGNENDTIKIFRYIADGSFDAYSWQLLESKQRLICQLLSGTVLERSASDIDDIVLDYAQVKALAVGNPLIKERVETDNCLKRLLALQHKLVETQTAMRQELLEIPNKINHTQSLIDKAEQDVELYQQNRIDPKVMKNRRQTGAQILDALSTHIMQASDKHLITYQGFNIILPKNTSADRPAIFLEGSGRYYTEVGDSDIGCISRIDNKLNRLSEFIEKQKQELLHLTTQKAHIESELAKNHSYLPSIERLQRKLKNIDKKLEVPQE